MLIHAHSATLSTHIFKYNLPIRPYVRFLIMPDKMRMNALQQTWEIDKISRNCVIARSHQSLEYIDQDKERELSKAVHKLSCLRWKKDK